jgi:hypothetical protein
MTFYLVYPSSSTAVADAERRLVRLKLGRYPEVNLDAARDLVRIKRVTPATESAGAPVVLLRISPPSMSNVTTRNMLTERTRKELAAFHAHRNATSK